MIIPFPEYAPDQARLSPAASGQVKNVLPMKGGYRPFPSLGVYSEELGGVCRGALTFVGTDGLKSFFAATADKIKRLAADGSWEDLSKSGGYNLPTGDYWDAIQFGNTALFTNVADPLQFFTVGSSTLFDDVAGNPPQARFITGCGDYVILGSTASFPGRIQRSGVNSFDKWTPKVAGSDYQDLPSDGGIVTGLRGIDQSTAIIFTDRAAVLYQDQPGSVVLFSITRISDINAVAGYGIAVAAGAAFFLSERGFYKFSRGDGFEPIGEERVNRTFLSELIDLSKLEEVQAAVDPLNSLVAWLYTSSSGGRGVLLYNWVLDKWSQADTAATYLVGFATPGYTLEELTSILGYTTLESIPFSLDSRVWRGGRLNLGGFDGNDKLGIYSGAPMEAVLETAGVSPFEGKLVQVNAFRPVGNIAGAFGKVRRAETFGDNFVDTSESGQNSTGAFPVRARGRILKFVVRQPAGEDWVDIQGVELAPEMIRAGGRR